MLISQLLLLGSGCPKPKTDTSPAPTPPSGVMARPASGSITVDWDLVPGAKSYVLYLATVPGVTRSNYASLPDGQRIEASSGQATATGLLNGTTYHLVVTARDAGGEGAESAEVSATPEKDCDCAGWLVCDVTRQCVPPAGTSDYLAGLCYHALSDRWTVNQPVPVLDNVFLPNYHRPGVREAVLARLTQLAAAGARVIKTQVWFVDDDLTGYHSWSFNFPPTTQQLRNLRRYAADVAATATPDGQPLELYLSNDWLGAADMGQGSPGTALGSSHLSAATYAARLQASFTGELDAIRGIYRADGRPAVTLTYLKGEMDVCSTLDDGDGACTWPGSSQPFHNMQWFMTTFYLPFVAHARAVGVIPSVYFQVNGDEPHILDTTWRDPYWPQLDGRISMTWVYRGLRFMRDNGLPIPDRIDMTTGVVDPIPYTTEATALARVYDDLLDILPEFQAPPYRYGAAEAFYYTDPSKLRSASRAFPSERLLGRGLEWVASWPQVNYATPHYDMSPFLTAGATTPFAALNGGFELPGAGGLPAGWAADGSGSTSAARAEVSDAHGGVAVLRLDDTTCSGCSGAISDAVPVTAGQDALVRLLARTTIQQAGGHPPAADYAGMIIQVRGVSAGNDVGPLLSFGTVNTQGSWRRFVGVVSVPIGVDALRLRLALQNAPGGVVDVDDLH
jgi:hypothetical protein